MSARSRSASKNVILDFIETRPSTAFVAANAPHSAQDGDNDFMPYIVYILECSDDSYYTGSTADLNKRLWEHEQGVMASAYTYSRRPVKLVWVSEQTEHYYDALRWERQIKGWSRAKKEALIRGDFDAIHEIVKTERKSREQNKKKPPR